MSCYGCKESKKEPTLTERLNKRVTILRAPGADEWPDTASNDGDFGVLDSKSYEGEESGSVFWNDWMPKTDQFGQPLNVLVEDCTVWAGIEPLQGREFFAAMAENAEVTTRIRVRYRAGIDRTMIVRYKAVEFEILYTINPKMANIELQLMCKDRQ